MLRRVLGLRDGIVPYRLERPAFVPAIRMQATYPSPSTAIEQECGTEHVATFLYLFEP